MENNKTAKIKNVFDLWYNGEIDETEIERNNKPLFDKINGEIETVKPPINIDIELLIYCDFDFECLYDNLYDNFMNGIKTYINDVLEIANKYKNENVKI